jgi:Rps23 Pro-64 3,4-dihydroxylase Tpa1-like proline 4-hydroxylase
MPQLQFVEKPESLFPYWKWSSKTTALAQEYRQNMPVPHIFLHDFLDTETAFAMANEFPGPRTDAWTQYKHQNENKLGLNKRLLFPPNLGRATDELNSPAFLEWISELTGIPNLVADPSLEGGGLHQSGKDGFLNVHTDFSMHHYHKNWRRRVNLIVYLNEEWNEQWGGAIELWDRQMKHCVARYPPRLNQALIFNTDENSFHGFPEALTCPESVTRKSLALYYYTVEKDGRFAARSTDYRARPGDGPGKAMLIWLDKKAVDFYSRAKTRFGFSDEFASKLLGRISKKK